MKLTIDTTSVRKVEEEAANTAASLLIAYAEDNYTPNQMTKVFTQLLEMLKVHGTPPGFGAERGMSPGVTGAPGLPSASAGTSHELAALQTLLESAHLSPGLKTAPGNLLAPEADPRKILVDATTGELLAVLALQEQIRALQGQIRTLQEQVNTAEGAAKKEVWRSVEEDLNKIDTALGGVTSKWGSSEVTGKDAVTAAIDNVRTKLRPSSTS